jgi:type III pantothenate kinase
MNLLVDIGNSRLKWGVTANHRVISGPFLVNNQINRQALIGVWKDLSSPARIAVSCVGAKKLSELVRTVALELWPKVEIIHAHSMAQGFGVVNAYSNPEKLGVDRWLALVAVRNQYESPACVVDCGTAITLDLLDDQGRHQGGMICPGLTLMKKSLSGGTESLEFSDAHYNLGPANFTEAAIHSGVLTAAVGMIEHVFAGQAEASLLILTGGDAQIVAAELIYKSIVDADLVLLGLAIVLEGSV